MTHFNGHTHTHVWLAEATGVSLTTSVLNHPQKINIHQKTSPTKIIGVRQQFFSNFSSYGNDMLQVLVTKYHASSSFEFCAVIADEGPQADVLILMLCEQSAQQHTIL